MRKRDRQRFVKQANKLIESLGGVHRERHNEWELETRFGRLVLHVTENYVGGPGTVFTRFDDPSIAKRNVCCNRCSGKWNHHYFEEWTVETALVDLEYRLRKVLPVAVEMA
jgi:acetylornithine deacetylase/succinyl-diaminopimelate desuccinylase-like protein